MSWGSMHELRCSNVRISRAWDHDSGANREQQADTTHMAVCVTKPVKGKNRAIIAARERAHPSNENPRCDTRELPRNACHFLSSGLLATGILPASLSVCNIRLTSKLKLIEWHRVRVWDPVVLHVRRSEF